MAEPLPTTSLEPRQPLLQMQGISKRFGATVALDQVQLAVAPGQVLALLGENGAGKSTLMKILSGVVTADHGQMRLGSQPFAPRNPHDARAAGVAMIFQELSLAPDLSIEDNIMLGQERHTAGFLRRAEQRQRVVQLLESLGHAGRDPRTPVRQLSAAERQLVEIARALQLDARVLVFDEPTSSLSQADAERLFQVIGRLRDAGRAIVYVSHFLEEVRRVCDSYTVLRDGRVAGSGRLADVTEADLVSLMAGRSVEQLFPRVPHQPGEVVLSVRNLSGRRLPRDVSFELRRGEILGLGGLVGAGRTELVRCLFGLDPITGGSIRLAGQLPGHSPRQRIRAGLGLVSEDRKQEGLAQIRSVADNLTYSRLSPYQLAGFLQLGKRRQAVAHWIEQLEIKVRSGEQPVETLSGGNQQKVALARVLHQQADVLLLDEPTRGIDVGTKSTIYQRMGQLAADGKAILFVSSYFPELLHVCDRVGVMTRGRLRDIRPVDQWTEESLLACAVDTTDTLPEIVA